MPKNLYQRGDTWYASFAVNGQRQRVSLRTGDKREARRRLEALKLKAEREGFGLRDAKTWDDAAEAYILGVLRAGAVKPGTAKRYEVSLRQLHPYFTGKPLPSITIGEVAAYVQRRQAVGATNATIRRDLTTMSRVLAYARAHEMTETNAAEAYDRKLVRERRDPLMIPGDDAISLAALKCTHPGLGWLILFLRCTGLRSGEALRLRWQDIRGNLATIIETKNGRERTIEIEPYWLPKRSVSPRLFWQLPATTDLLASLWQRERKHLPEECQFRLHDLRHAYAIAEIRAGRDIYDLSHHLGHSSVKVTEVYLGYRAGSRAQQRSRGTGGDDDPERRARV